MRGPDYQRRMTTPELHWLLGRDLAAIEKQLKVKQPLAAVDLLHRQGVPIFVGAVQDQARSS